jgi:hypothetical protein
MDIRAIACALATYRTRPLTLERAIQPGTASSQSCCDLRAHGVYDDWYAFWGFMEWDGMF